MVGKVVGEVEVVVEAAVEEDLEVLQAIHYDRHQVPENSASAVA